MPDESTDRSSALRLPIALATVTCLTVAAYAFGLSGDFLFDDNPHIVRNVLVQIDSLAPQALWQAWHSGLAPFPHDRPLAMLTFGLNHVTSGLEPVAFKATNLALHLLTGLVLFAVARRLGAAFLRLERRDIGPAAVDWWAWLTAALWLLHPLNLSPVLLVVQRMTILATLFVLLGMLVYLVGRERLAAGKRIGLLWIWAAPGLALVGLMGKENALLLPLLLLVTEWTLLRFRGLSAASRRHMRLFFAATVALPALLVLAFLASNPYYLQSAERPFTLIERLLTEARALWFYLRLLLSPDITAMGLFHDDFPLSRDLLQPWTTLVAIAGWTTVVIVVLALRRRVPLLAFAALFFLAGHALESTVIPLELVYEHRNYLPAIGPLFALAFVPTAHAAPRISRPLVRALTGVVLVSLAAATAVRAHDWSGFGRLITTEVRHHPLSPRANFQFAQLLMTQLDNGDLRDDAARLARAHFEKVAALHPDNADALFGLVVLELHLGSAPAPELIERLATVLRHAPFSPLNVNIGQFAFLVNWQGISEEARARLSTEQITEIFEAALENPTVPPIGRAAIRLAMSAYFHDVLGDPHTALRHAELAAEAAPAKWGIQDQRIRLLAGLGRVDDATAVLREAVRRDTLGLHSEQAEQLDSLIEEARRAEPFTTTTSDGRDTANGPHH
jgi:tetratricopeptide (TPR) repeat protein